MKYIKSINENLDEFLSIEDWCEKFGLEDYNVREDGYVDVDSWTTISNKDLELIPIKFNAILGSFDCSNNNLKSLNGSPRILTNSFYCEYNSLTTLDGSLLKKINDDYYCNNNKLTTLIGGPEIINVDFNCSDNNLINIDGFPKEVNGLFCVHNNPVYNLLKLFKNKREFEASLDYNYLRGTDIIKHRFEEACEEANRRVPGSIHGYRYV